ncbi:MAG: DUF4296 domain-containing protein [Chitinophagaceae bacterium]
MDYKLVCLVLIVIISCKSGGVPGNVLPVDEMKVVMWDVLQADEYANYAVTKDSSKNVKQETLRLYSKVFALHKISGDDFGRSYKYYREHPAMEKLLLDSIQVYGNKMREANYQRVKFELPIVKPVIRDSALKY